MVFITSLFDLIQQPFFGFVNDDSFNSYTIGVTVFNPNTKGKKYYQYYASQSAVPVFKEVVESLGKLGYLALYL